MGNKTVKEKTKNVIKKTEQGIILFLFAIFLCYVFTTIYSLMKKPNNVIILEHGKVAFEEETEGLLIRDEQIIKGAEYAHGILQIKKEGEKVAKGESIFRYYRDTENNIKQKIEDIELQIQENIEQQGEVPSSDLPLIEAQIKHRLEGISELNDLQKINDCKQEITSYMTKKVEIISELSTDNSEIKKLIKQKENYEKEVTKNSEYINAPISGVVSYRIDNLEEILNVDNFDYLNKKFIDGLNAKVGQIIATSEEKGKIINNFESYIAVTVKSDMAKMAKIGNQVALKISNLEQINATIEHIFVEEDDSRTIIFKITNKIEELVKYRKVSLAIIWWEVEGFRVPNNVLKTENNTNYIVRNKAGNHENVLVKIMRQNENYSIIDNYSTEELKALGYTNKEIAKMNKLNLYDEIILEN